MPSVAEKMDRTLAAAPEDPVAPPACAVHACGAVTRRG
jgi:hypothetical protein